MDSFLINYKEELKKLISESYEPADMLSKEIEFSTGALTLQLKTILPYNAIDDHLVYEALTELGFKPQEKEPLLFYWYFRRK